MTEGFTYKSVQINYTVKKMRLTAEVQQTEVNMALGA